MGESRRGPEYLETLVEAVASGASISRAAELVGRSTTTCWEAIQRYAPDLPRTVKPRVTSEERIQFLQRYESGESIHQIAMSVPARLGDSRSCALFRFTNHRRRASLRYMWRADRDAALSALYQQKNVVKSGEYFWPLFPITRLSRPTKTRLFEHQNSAGFRSTAQGCRSRPALLHRLNCSVEFLRCENSHLLISFNGAMKMAAVKMCNDELEAVRDLLLKAADAISHGMVSDHDDVGIIARALCDRVDRDEFNQGLLSETTNPRLERWMAC